MASSYSHSAVNPNLYNNPSIMRKGRASVTGAPSRPSRPSITKAMRPGRSSVPTNYVPRTSSSSSGSDSDSGKSTDTDSNSDTSTVASSIPDSSYSSSPKRRMSVLSMFQSPSTSNRRSSFVEKILPHQKEPQLETSYGRCSTPLGSGSHANVLLCDSKVRGRLYAIKRFRKLKPHESEREYNKRLFGEYCISSTMRHENIVETFDMIRNEDNRLCLVMELCAGGDLFSYIKETSNRTPNFPEIHCYFRQLINGISYLHSNGVAHRDIKPENLLLSGDGTTLKISDFGVAEVFKTISDRQAHKCTGLCGSEPYIAPEQFESNKSEYDAAKVDLWSVGIVFFALLTGSMPWRRAARGDSDYERYIDALNRDSSFHVFERVDGPARDMLYMLLKPDARLRYSSKEVQKDKWVASIPFCHADDPSPHHTHLVMAHYRH